MKKWLILALLHIGSACYAQSAKIDWTNVHQVIDGFGAGDMNMNIAHQLTTAQQAFFYGTGTGQIGLSVLRTGIPEGDGTDVAGDCSTVSTDCVGYAATDLGAAKTFGVRVIAVADSPIVAWKTNGLLACSPGNGSLISTHYQDFANWILNYVKSLQTYVGITPYAVSPYNEPDGCWATDSTVYSGAQGDNLIANFLGPTLASNGFGDIIISGGEASNYANASSVASACAADQNCSKYVGAWVFHDYDAQVSIAGPTANNATYPASFAAGKKWWMTEVGCQAGGGGPSWCTNSFDGSMNNALFWAAELDNRFAVQNLGLWGYWWLVVDHYSPGNGLGLIDTAGNIAQRAYVVGQYSKFIRPGYFRIDGTHAPQANITVSAYQDVPSNTLVIVATNYSSSPVSQSFSISNAPTFTALTPYVTSATLSLSQQSAQALSSNAFTYILPAESVTTFVGASSGSTAAAPPTNLRAVVN